MKHIDKTATEKPLHVAYTPRHAKPETRLGADDPQVKELFEPSTRAQDVVAQFGQLLHDVGVGNPFRGRA